MEHVTPEVQQSYLTEGENLSQWYLNLAKSGKAFDSRLKLDARHTYRTVLKQTPKNVKKLDEWIQRWQDAMAMAQRYEVPEALDIEVWSDDLMVAMGPLMESWTSNFRSSMRGVSEEEGITYQSVASDLLQEWTILHGSTSRGGRGAFLALHGEEAQPLVTEDLTETSGQTSRPSVTQPRGRGGGRGRSRGRGSRGREDRSTTGKRSYHEAHRSTDAGSKCKGCMGTGHGVSHCWYIFPEKAPKDFNLHQGMIKLVLERVKTIPGLKEEIDRITKSKATTEEPRQ